MVARKFLVFSCSYAIVPSSLFNHYVSIIQNMKRLDISVHLGIFWCIPVVIFNPCRAQASIGIQHRYPTALSHAISKCNEKERTCTLLFILHFFWLFYFKKQCLKHQMYYFYFRIVWNLKNYRLTRLLCKEALMS